MSNKGNNVNKDSRKLKSYSDVRSFDRLSNRDAETASSITAGGDESFLSEDIYEYKGY